MKELHNTNVYQVKASSSCSGFSPITPLAITVIFQVSFVVIIAPRKVLLAVILYLMMVHRAVVDFV